MPALTEKQIEKRISELSAELANLKQQKHEKKKSKMFQCQYENCKKKSKIGECSLVIPQYYEDCPYTPSWSSSDERGIKCPKCNTWHRCLSDESKTKYILPNKSMWESPWKETIEVYQGHFQGYPKYKIEDDYVDYPFTYHTFKYWSDWRNQEISEERPFSLNI